MMNVNVNLIFNMIFEVRLSDFIDMMFIFLLNSSNLLLQSLSYCKGGIPLLLYEAPILPERWRTSPRHVRKYGCAAQPAWHVRVRCRTTSMYIDPGFAQLLA